MNSITSPLPRLRSPVFAAFAVASATALSMGRLSAHPGHSLADEGVLHAVTSPYHLGILLAAGLGLCGIAGLALREGSRAQRWMKVAGITVTCSAGVLWGLAR